MTKPKKGATGKPRKAVVTGLIGTCDCECEFSNCCGSSCFLPDFAYVTFSGIDDCGDDSEAICQGGQNVCSDMNKAYVLLRDPLQFSTTCNFEWEGTGHTTSCTWEDPDDPDVTIEYNSGHELVAIGITSSSLIIRATNHKDGHTQRYVNGSPVGSPDDLAWTHCFKSYELHTASSCGICEDTTVETDQAGCAEGPDTYMNGENGSASVTFD